MSISPEDGVSLSATVRQRWQQGTQGSASRSAIVLGSFYKSLDLPGYAHHVLALRLAGGFADSRSPTDYTVGGVSGSSLEIVPGFSIGDQARTFPVRGYAPNTERGTRAWAASFEYRAPITIPSRGLDLVPVFLDRVSVALFADAGRAYCAGQGAPACAQSAFGAPTLASVGGELNLDAALQYDLAYRFRLGVAAPVGRSASMYRQRAATVYLTLGSSF
jgi:outer membrane protein assembly factor BamA